MELEQASRRCNDGFEKDRKLLQDLCHVTFETLRVFERNNCTNFTKLPEKEKHSIAMLFINGFSINQPTNFGTYIDLITLCRLGINHISIHVSKDHKEIWLEIAWYTYRNEEFFEGLIKFLEMDLFPAAMNVFN